MRKLRALWFRLFGMLGSGHKQDEFADELESHLAMHIEDGIRAGLSANEARRQALIRLGGMEQAKIAHRERSGLPWLEMLMQDVSFSLRVLRKDPGFTLIAVLTLALGIGANTALFSIVQGVLLNPLPFPHPEELITVHASKPNFPEGSISYPNFRDWQRENKTLAALAISRGTGFNMTGLGDAEEMRAQAVSSDFFSILGIKPVLGRLFAPSEDEIGRAPLVLISEGFWRRKLGSRPDVLGRPLTLDGKDYTIVGVLPASLHLRLRGFIDSDLYVPIGQFANNALNDRSAGLGLHGIARLKPGVTLAQAQDDMLRVSERLEKDFPVEDAGIRARLVSLQDSMVRDVKPLLLVLLGAVGFVLLIACVNVANLLLARSNARAQEFAVRSALGAGHARLLRQLLTESSILSLTGGALGLLIAALGTQAALKVLPVTLPRAENIHMSGPVLCFTLAVSLAAGMLFGLAPALKVFRQSLVSTLKEGGRGASGARYRTQNALVIFQMALALVLLAGAGLAIRSLMQLSKVPLGFSPQDVLTFGLQAPPAMSHASLDAVRNYLRAAESKLEATPGVAAVSFSWGALPMRGDDETEFWLEGEPKPQNERDMHMSIRYIVTSGYLKTMGLSLQKGRFLAASDDEHAPRVVVVDDVFAKKFFGNADPIGRRIHIENFDDPATIIGVVAHVNQWGLDTDASNTLRVETYESMMQLPEQQIPLLSMGMDVLVRSKTHGAAVFPAIQRSMAEMSREQVVYNPTTMESTIADSLAGWRFSMILLSIFAAVALLLASVGMYGVLSYVVGQRMQEIGIRMALGADRRNVLLWVLGHGARLALIGAAVGVAAALGLTQIMQSSSLLYGVHAYDPWTLGCMTLLLMLVAIGACCVPALRAMGVDPMRVLRTA
jgi:predicted permease